MSKGHAGLNRRYWSAIKNTHARLNDSGEQGKRSRKAYFEQTGNKVFKESNYQKAIKAGKGTGISIKIVRKSFKEIKNNRIKSLKDDYKELKDKGEIDQNFDEFEKANRDPDWEEIIEQFNSPD